MPTLSVENQERDIVFSLVSIRSSLDITIKADDVRVVSADKLAVQVLLAVVTGVAPPVEGLTITDEVSLLWALTSHGGLPAADTFLGLVTEIKISLTSSHDCVVFTSCSSPHSWWSCPSG